MPIHRSHRLLACAATCLCLMLGCYHSPERPTPAGGYSEKRIEYKSTGSLAITEEHTAIPESMRKVLLADMSLDPNSPCKIDMKGPFTRNEELCLLGRLLRKSKSKTPAIIFIDIFRLPTSKNTSANGATNDARLHAVTMGTTNRPIHSTDSLSYRVRVKLPADLGKYRFQARVITNPKAFPGIIIGAGEFTVR